jgi:uncharacterized protein (DUF58 family)
MAERGGFLWRFLALLACLAAAAVNTGNNLLYLVLSLMVGAAGVGLAAASRSLRRLDTNLLLPEEVAAGRPFILGIEAISREARLPTGWAEAELSGLPAEVAPVRLPALPPGGRTVVSATARVLRRGVHEEIGLSLGTTYPFGLFRRRRRTARPARLVVTPRRRRIRSLVVESPAADGSHRARRPGEGADLFNIRDYTTQDDARRIDWKASARLERPMLKEFEHDQERAVEIVLDERAGPAADPASFEDLVETAASILDHGAERGIHARLLVARGDGRASVLEGRSAMAYLAEVRPRPGAPHPDAAGPRAAGVPRIVLSTDPAARTRIHIEWAEPRSAA